MLTNNEQTIREKLEAIKKNLYEELNLLKLSMAEGMSEGKESSLSSDEKTICKGLYVHSEITKNLIKHRRSYKRTDFCPCRKYNMNRKAM